MKRYYLLMTLIVLLSILSVGAWSDVILQIETICVSLNQDAVIHFNMDNPDDEVAALQVDILFDIECFTVTAVNKTSRSENMDIFNYSHITGGIRIAMTGIGHQIDPGNGPVAEINVAIGNCPGMYMLDLTGSIVAGPLGQEIPFTELDDYIDCDPWIYVSSENVDFGYVPVGQTAVETVTITFFGRGWPVEIRLEPEGCADAVPRLFVM